jgi:hypothetical protein
LFVGGGGGSLLVIKREFPSAPLKRSKALKRSFEAKERLEAKSLKSKMHHHNSRKHGFWSAKAVPATGCGE